VIAARHVGAAAIAALVAACGSAGDEEIQAETAAIQARVPAGTPVADALAVMREAGFACVPEVRETQQHFSCVREQSHWLVCTRRTRVILPQQNGKVTDILVNVGRVCA
jgi:hypothetical protein